MIIVLTCCCQPYMYVRQLTSHNFSDFIIWGGRGLGFIYYSIPFPNAMCFWVCVSVEFHHLSSVAKLLNVAHLPFSCQREWATPFARMPYCFQRDLDLDIIMRVFFLFFSVKVCQFLVCICCAVSRGDFQVCIMQFYFQRGPVAILQMPFFVQLCCCTKLLLCV